jgi:hypothetical protein
MFANTDPAVLIQTDVDWAKGRLGRWARIIEATAERSSLLQARRFGRWRLRTSRESAEGDVLIETIHSFKGRDQRIVILAELGRLEELKAWKGDAVTALLYVGCSRATQLLMVLAEGSLRDQLRNLGATVVDPRIGTASDE